MCLSLAVAEAFWSLDLAEMLIDVLNYQIPAPSFQLSHIILFLFRGGGRKGLLSLPEALKGAPIHKRHPI